MSHTDLIRTIEEEEESEEEIEKINSINLGEKHKHNIIPFCDYKINNQKVLLNIVISSFQHITVLFFRVFDSTKLKVQRTALSKNFMSHSNSGVSERNSRDQIAYSEQADSYNSLKKKVCKKMNQGASCLIYNLIPSF